MTDAKRVGRICVWPTEEIAREADTADSKYVRRLVVWPTTEDAIENTHLSAGGGGGGDLPDPPVGFHYIVNADGKYIINGDGAYLLTDGET